ncbi:hypothetical protein F4819DRAFT_485912 [Hypoxylon fuscum]|nr:hypothetical protein F4819DRAFT_485912 [Hypoxylon fuscum]
MANKYDEPPAYGAPPQHPQASYQGGYPPQGPGPYGGDPNQQNHYQSNPNMGYYQQGQGPPPQGGYPGGPYPPQQGGYYPQQQGYPPQGYPPQQRNDSRDGCLGALLGLVACCCCLDCLF